MTIATSAERTATAFEAAEKGLNWLKKSGPRYGLDYRLINSSTVSVRDEFLCPLGQASSGRRYMNVIAQIGEQRNLGAFSDFRWSCQHGFSSPFGSSASAQAELTAAWRQLLQQDQVDRDAAVQEERP